MRVFAVYPDGYQVVTFALLRSEAEDTISYHQRIYVKVVYGDPCAIFFFTFRAEGNRREAIPASPTPY